MRIVEKTGISFDANAVLRRTDCIGKDAMQSGDGTRGENMEDRMADMLMNIGLGIILFGFACVMIGFAVLVVGYAISEIF